MILTYLFKMLILKINHKTGNCSNLPCKILMFEITSSNKSLNFNQLHVCNFCNGANRPSNKVFYHQFNKDIESFPLKIRSFNLFYWNVNSPNLIKMIFSKRPSLLERNFTCTSFANKYWQQTKRKYPCNNCVELHCKLQSIEKLPTIFNSIEIFRSQSSGWFSFSTSPLNANCE